MLTFREIGRQGRFGNQMFQYATLLGVARRRGYAFGVPYGTVSPDDYLHFSLPDAFPGLTALNCAPVGPADAPRFREKAWYHFHPEVFDQPDGTDLVGYFQCEQYFRHVRAELAAEFTADPRAAEFVAGVRARLGCPLVAVHVRRGDYLMSPCHPVLGSDYYTQALARFPDHGVIVCSDDPAWCRATFHGAVAVSPFTDPFTDFEVMRRCDHHVTANSTFSWWAAWLNPAPGKRVVIPRVYVRTDPAGPPASQLVHCDGWEIV